MSGSASPAARGGGHETNHTCVAHNTSAGAGAGAGAGPSVSAAARTSPDAAGLVRASAQRASHRPPLVGAKVTLRPYRASDVDALVENANDRDVWINLRNLFPHPYTRDDAIFWVNLQSKSTEPLATLAIDVGGEYAGSIGIEQHSDVHSHSAELGYWIGRKHWGKGVMTQAVRLFLPYVFSHFDLLRVEAGCYARNVSSARVLEKAGFTFEGRLRKSVVKDGVILDQLMHSILRDEVFPPPVEPEATAAAP